MRDLATEVDDPLLGIRSHFLIANTHWSLGEKEEAVGQWEKFIEVHGKRCGSSAAKEHQSPACVLADLGALYVAHFRVGLHFGNQTISMIGDASKTNSAYEKSLDHLVKASMIINCPASLFVAAKVAFSMNERPRAKSFLDRGKALFKICPPQAPIITDPNADFQWLEHNLK